MKFFFLAVAFLTAIPVSPSLLPQQLRLSPSAPFFPVVGALLGLFLGGLAILGLLVFPTGVVVVVTFMVEFALTRGLHLDGLADTADGLAASAGPERALEIMRDGAVGPMGTCALLFFFLFKYAALTGMEPSLLVPSVIALPAAGRWCMVLAGAATCPARKEGLGQSFIAELGWKEAAASSVLPAGLLMAVCFIWPTLFLPLLTGAVSAVLVSLLFILAVSRFLGGATGDLLGAACLVAEIGFLAGVAAW